MCGKPVGRPADARGRARDQRRAAENPVRAVQGRRGRQTWQRRRGRLQPVRRAGALRAVLRRLPGPDRQGLRSDPGARAGPTPAAGTAPARRGAAALASGPAGPHPNNCSYQARSSVCRSADRVASRRRRSASVDFSLPPRPSTASTRGRPPGTLAAVATSRISSEVRTACQEPAAGSPAGNDIAMLPSMRDVHTTSRCESGMPLPRPGRPTSARARRCPRDSRPSPSAA
jgi:hypothetical protein